MVRHYVGIIVVLVGSLSAAMVHGDDAVSQQASTPSVILQVELASGRIFTGVPDQRTNQEHLWLRAGSPSASLTRPISWDVIQEIRHEERVLSAAEVQKLAEGDDGHAAVDLSQAERIVERGRIIVRHPVPATNDSNLLAAPPASSTRRPSRLQIDARVENFDSDPENDGLLVELRLLDDRGRSVPFQGTALVQWFGPQARKDTFSSPPRGVELGAWSVNVKSDGNGAATYLQLPFQRLNPEQDPTLWNYSCVQVTVNVPGVGEFSAERDGVRIRRWEPYRDFNQTHFNGPLVQPSGRRR